MITSCASAAERNAYAAMTSFGSALTYQKLEGRANGVQTWGANTVNLLVAGGTVCLG